MPGGKPSWNSSAEAQRPRRRVETWAEYFTQLLGSMRPRSDTSGDQEPVIGELLSYEITTEPISENPADYGLTANQYGQITKITEQLRDQSPGAMVQALENLIDQYPHVPKLWNHLAVAYQAAQRSGDAERIIEDTYRRFPNYLFGIMNYAMQRIQQGHPEDIPGILRGTFAPHELQQGRQKFHLSEIRSYFGMLASYFLAIHQPERAAGYLDILEELAPEHPLTQTVRSQMLLQLSEVMLGGDAE